MNKLPTQYQEYIHLSRYSRWLPEEKRRETWEETVSRYFKFFSEHLKENFSYEIPIGTYIELEEAVLLQYLNTGWAIVGMGPTAAVGAS